MTPEQHITAFKNTIRDLEIKRGEMIGKLGASALTLIKERVIEKGIDAKGSKYKPYSTKAMLVGCKSMNKSVCNKVFGKKKNKELEWVTINGRHLAVLEGGYKQFRELHGRQTNHVDFSFSNDMWNDINVISTTSDHQKGIAIIGAKQDIEKKKLVGNTKRRGDILDLNPNEILDLYRTYHLNSLEIFRNNGL